MILNHHDPLATYFNKHPASYPSPLQYNDRPNTPSNENPLTGYYISSFLTTTTGNQSYMVTGILGTSEVTNYGFSILDLDTLECVAYGNTTVYSASKTTSFNLTRDTYCLL
jgi:hypothetical protein